METPIQYPVSHDNPVFKELVSILGNGFVLSLFTIDFFCFEYVLPILGSLIMLYGCHLVKDHNIFFKRTYILALIRFITMLINFMIDWTKFHDNIVITYIQITIAAVLIISIFFYMNLAFKDIHRQAGALKSYNNRLNQYIILYLCTILSTYLTVHLGILGAMLSLFILILNIVFLMLTFYQLGTSLSKLDVELTLTHYTSAELRHIFFLLSGYGLILCMTIIVSNKALFLPVHSSSQLSSSNSEQNDTEKKLLDLGLDREVLADLPKSEIKLLETASSLTCDSSVKDVNNGSLKIIIYDIICEKEHRILVYYQWLTPPESRLYQIIECQYPKDRNSAATHISSKAYVLNEKNRERLELPNIHLGLNDASYPYVQHKLSNAGNNLKGYLAFSYEPAKETGDGISYTINYYYQASVFNLPYLNIMDYMNHYAEHTNSMVFDQISMKFTLKP